MKSSVFILFILAAAALGISAQVKPRAKATPAVIPSIVPIKKGSRSVAAAKTETGLDGAVSGRKYSNEKLGFGIVFPDEWLIAEQAFEAEMKKQGYDLSLKAPDSLSPAEQAKVNRAVKGVSILLTAYRGLPGATDNAVARISIEDLSENPQIKDAVDYFDAIRAMYKTLQLPTDFTYSETKAERLGKMQFGFIDTTSKEGKKRMYATVRRGYAIMFTLSYTNDDDLATMRRILEEGNFELKKP